MKYGISLLNFRPSCIGGAETYLKKLIQHLPASASGDLVFIVNQDNHSVIPEGIDTMCVPWSMRTTIAARIAEAFTPWRATQLSRMISDANIDVMFYPQQSLFPLNNPVPTVMTVVDLQHLFYPEYFSVFDRTFRATIYVKSLQKATQIIAISHHVKKTLMDSLKIASNKIEVIHLGFDPYVPKIPIPTSLISEKFLYYPSASFPHKGHAQLLQSFSKLVHANKMPYKLVFSGMKTKYWGFLARRIRQLDIQDHVIHVGFVPYDEVISLYNEADAILFPSEYEGFGIPVLEAYRFEKKLICSKLPVFDEVGIPKSWQIDFSDPNDLLKAINRQEITKLNRKPLTWKECAEQTALVLEKTSHQQHGFSNS